MAVQTATSQPATPAQPSQIDTQPMKKAYDDWSKITGGTGGLNRQIRNYNIKTALKITLLALAFLASAAAITFAAFSLLGSSFPLIAFSSKVIASSAIGVGITLIFAKIFKNVINKKLLEAQNKLIAKIKIDFQKKEYKNSDPIIEALFKKLMRWGNIDIEGHISFKELKGGSYSVKKIELESFEKVEKRYKKYHTYEQKRIRQERKERRFRRSVGELKEKIELTEAGAMFTFFVVALRAAYLAVNMIF